MQGNRTRMPGQDAEQVVVVALQCRDEWLAGRDLQHQRAVARWAGEVGILGETLGQVVDETEEPAADQSDQEIFLRRPVEIDRALSHMGPVCDVRDGKSPGAAANQEITGRFEESGRLGRIPLGQLAEGGAHGRDYIGARPRATVDRDRPVLNQTSHSDHYGRLVSFC